MENNNRGFKKDRRQQEQKEPNKVGLLLRNTIKEQILDFLTLAPEERYEGSKDLYYVGAYPAVLASDSVPEAENYGVYQLERVVRLRKEEPEKMTRLSTSIVLIDKKTGTPAFYLSSYITPKGIANVRVIPFDEKGPMYRDAIVWDNRDEYKEKEEAAAE